MMHTIDAQKCIGLVPYNSHFILFYTSPVIKADLSLGTIYPHIEMLLLTT